MENPFLSKKSYADILKEIGKTTVKDYYSEILTDEEITYLQNELNIYKQLTKTPK